MKKDKKENQEKQTQENNPSYQFRKQYIKTMHFENLMDPMDLIQLNKMPNNKLQLNFSTNKNSDSSMGVELNLGVEGTLDEDTLYKGTVEYVCMVDYQNIDEKLEKFMVIDALQQLYPFARRVLMDSMQEAGYPTPILQSINFSTVYHRLMEAQSKKDNGKATD